MTNAKMKARLTTLGREAAGAMAAALAATLNAHGVRPSDLPTEVFTLAGILYDEEGFVFPVPEDGVQPYTFVSWEDDKGWVADPVLGA